MYKKVQSVVKQFKKAQQVVAKIKGIVQTILPKSKVTKPSAVKNAIDASAIKSKMTGTTTGGKATTTTGAAATTTTGAAATTTTGAAATTNTKAGATTTGAAATTTTGAAATTNAKTDAAAVTQVIYDEISFGDVASSFRPLSTMLADKVLHKARPIDRKSNPKPILMDYSTPKFKGTQLVSSVVWQIFANPTKKTAAELYAEPGAAEEMGILIAKASTRILGKVAMDTIADKCKIYDACAVGYWALNDYWRWESRMRVRDVRGAEDVFTYSLFDTAPILATAAQAKGGTAASAGASFHGLSAQYVLTISVNHLAAWSMGTLLTVDAVLAIVNDAMTRTGLIASAFHDAATDLATKGYVNAEGKTVLAKSTIVTKLFALSSMSVVGSGLSPDYITTTGDFSAPTASPTLAPVATPTRRPINAPTAKPTFKLSEKPTAKPTNAPTAKPSSKPSEKPTTKPSNAPSANPTNRPPTARPTNAPVASKPPTFAPSKHPTFAPSKRQTFSPSKHPTAKPTDAPSKPPVNTRKTTTTKPTRKPTKKPTRKPTDSWQAYGAAE